jgi:hypothetical protein
LAVVANITMMAMGAVSLIEVVYLGACTDSIKKAQ